jgi:hypothetical protein
MTGRCCVWLILGAAMSGTVAHGQTTKDLVIELNGRDKGRVFEGIGAASAGASSRLLIDYPEPQRGEILDYLFKPHYGAALQHLKVEVGGDVNSTDGSEPSHMRSRDDHDYTRGYEWWLMEEASKRNPAIELDILPWGAPGWVGGGHLYSNDMAEYMADFLVGAKKVHGLDILYAGIWNEKPFDGDYVKQFARILKQRGLSTKIVCCDAYPGLQYGEWGIVDSMQKDAALRDAVSVIGVHYPSWGNSPLTPEAAKQAGVPLWSSEDQPNPGSGPFVSREWAAGGKVLAKQYIRNYLDGAFTKTEIWSPITSYYDILAAPNSGLMYANTPWSGHYDVQSTIWVTAHTTQFALPGWRYLDGASGKLAGGGSYVSLKSPASGDWSVILETIDASSPATITFRLSGGLASGRVHIWETNASRTFEHVADAELKDDTFTFTFEAGSLYSLTTTTGQARGPAHPPVAAEFPMPYEDNFEGSALNRSARYLADQDGAFEVLPCRGRSGRCLEQVITSKPIPWGPLPDPFTFAGDVHWVDYVVRADLQVPIYGTATLMARIDSSDVFRNGSALWPSGYVLRLTADGHWELLSASYEKPTVTLASGLADMKSEWHHAEIVCRGSSISVYLESQRLAEVNDTSHTHGMFGLGSDWSRVQFDNLSVKPAH